MHITQKSAQNIVNEMKASIHRDINIMDENGVILASTDPARRGKLHQGALAIIREGLDCLTVRQDEPERGIQRGVNLPVTLRGQLEGVIGITGEPKEVAVFGEIIRHMTEIMLEAAYQQEELELLQRSRSLWKTGCLTRSRTGRSCRCGGGCWGSTLASPTPWPF